MTEKRLALVTGANRGLGLATSRMLKAMGYEVIGNHRVRHDNDAALEKETGIPIYC